MSFFELHLDLPLLSIQRIDEGSDSIPPGCHFPATDTLEQSPETELSDNSSQDIENKQLEDLSRNLTAQLGNIENQLQSIQSEVSRFATEFAIDAFKSFVTANESVVLDGLKNLIEQSISGWLDQTEIKVAVHSKWAQRLQESFGKISSNSSVLIVSDDSLGETEAMVHCQNGEQWLWQLESQLCLLSEKFIEMTQQGVLSR